MRAHVYVVVALATRVTFADPATAKRAAALFEDGRAAIKAGDVKRACELFATSYELDPAPIGTALNLGDCLEREGHFVRARKVFDTAAAQLERTHDARAGFARDREKAVGARVATVVGKVPEPIPDGTQVKIGDSELPAAPELRVEVDPGALAIAVTWRDRPAFATRATAKPGDTTTIDVPPPATRPPPIDRAQPPVASSPAPFRRSRGRVHVAWALAGGAGVAAAATATLAVVAKRDYDAVVHSSECSQSPFVCTPTGAALVGQARSIANAGTGFAIAAIALAGGAAVVYWTAPRERLTVAPAATPTAAGVIVSGRF